MLTFSSYLWHREREKKFINWWAITLKPEMLSSAEATIKRCSQGLGPLMAYWAVAFLSLPSWSQIQMLSQQPWWSLNKYAKKGLRGVDQNSISCKRVTYSSRSNVGNQSNPFIRMIPMTDPTYSQSSYDVHLALSSPSCRIKSLWMLSLSL